MSTLFFCSLYILRDKLSCFYYISTIFFALRYMYYVYWLCLLWLKNGGKYVLRWESGVSIKLSYLPIRNIGKSVQLKNYSKTYYIMDPTHRYILENSETI